MPDITMCSGAACKQREECYRHKAEPSDLQSYFTETPRNFHNDTCVYFWKMEEDKHEPL
jgi:lipopolysaccharide biosynthesis protein